MPKTKKSKIMLVAIMIFSMVAIYSFIPIAHAVSLNNAKDTISDSGLSAPNVTHLVTFITGVAVPLNGYINVTFPAAITGIDVANVACSSGATGGVNGQIVTCSADGAQIDPGAQSIRVTQTTNPGTAGPYTISIKTYSDLDVLLEESDVMVYIINNVTVTANVPANLTFSISGLDAGTNVNGVLTTATSTATSTPFGTLKATASTTLGQQLQVSTNADDGYSVTVFEDQELTSAAGSNINSFDNSPSGTGSSTPVTWVDPKGELDAPQTYGHMGFTSNDSTLTWGGGDPFGTALYAGFSGTSSVEVMSHDGPVNGTVSGKGIAQVAYTVQISALQEAGDYSNTLTYVCTPQY